MSRMVRRQIYIEPEQDKVLKQRARELGVSEAELIRRCIDQMSRPPVNTLVDRKAWQEEVAYIRERARAHKALCSQREWTREELYDERLQRFSH